MTTQIIKSYLLLLLNEGLNEDWSSLWSASEKVTLFLSRSNRDDIELFGEDDDDRMSFGYTSFLTP
jgi:hypothetical protein